MLDGSQGMAPLLLKRRACVSWAFYDSMYALGRMKCITDECIPHDNENSARATL